MRVGKQTSFSAVLSNLTGPEVLVYICSVMKYSYSCAFNAWFCNLRKSVKPTREITKICCENCVNMANVIWQRHCSATGSAGTSMQNLGIRNGRKLVSAYNGEGLTWGTTIYIYMTTNYNKGYITTTVLG